MKVKLDDVIEMLEFVNDSIDASAYYNCKTNEFIYIGTYSNKDEDELEDCISLPSKYNIDEYEMMEDFIETIDEGIIYNQLSMAICGKGAFRRFKDTCIRFKCINDWYKYRDKRYKQIAIDWCNENNIEYE